MLERAEGLDSRQRGNAAPSAPQQTTAAKAGDHARIIVNGVTVAEVTVQGAGPGTVFHFNGDVGNLHAAVSNLDNVDATSAAAQTA